MRPDTSNMPTTIVTTSWDDGHHTDLRLAERLAAYALKGTFYVALNHPRDKDIGDDEIRALQRTGMEIGSHTLTHRSADRPVSRRRSLRTRGKQDTPRGHYRRADHRIFLARGRLHGSLLRGPRRNGLYPRANHDGVPHADDVRPGPHADLDRFPPRLARRADASRLARRRYRRPCRPGCVSRGWRVIRKS